MASSGFLTLFDGICDQTKELRALGGSMSNGVKWIFSSIGRYMFLRFDSDTSLIGSNYHYSTLGFLAKINYGNEILYQNLQRMHFIICFNYYSPDRTL